MSKLGRSYNVKRLTRPNVFIDIQDLHSSNRAMKRAIILNDNGAKFHL